MELREKFHDYRALLEKSVKWNEIDYIHQIDFVKLYEVWIKDSLFP